MRKGSIIDFIKTGSLGGVTLGMSEEDVVSIMGPPENRLETPDAFYISYNWWEIHFLKEKSGHKAILIHNKSLLNNVINHDEQIQFKNDQFEIELDFIEPFKHIRLKDVEELFTTEGIGFELVEKDWLPLLTTESGVYMDFSDTEPVSFAPEGIRWGPGRNQRLQRDEKRIENREDWILYTIGIGN